MTAQAIKAPKKLIEVGLPLDAINAAAAREKSIRHGHPSTLHLWWARRPLAAARAVIFGQMINDPSWKWEMDHPGELPPNNIKASWAASRKRLFGILEELVKWENTSNEEIFEKARAEIRKSWRETCEINKNHPRADTLFDPDLLPVLHDPFAGGGAIPLEAQRLGFQTYASDLNPVAVLINKAMIEIPPKFTGRPPANPDWQNLRKEEKTLQQWRGAQGLAEDVRYYGQWMSNAAKKRIGKFYPNIEVTADLAKDRPDLKPLVGQKPTVIAWLWARTVKSPNPAFRHVDVPLASTFILSTKEGRATYVEAVVKGDRYTFVVRVGQPPVEALVGTKAGGSGSAFLCLFSKTPIEFAYLREEAKRGRMGQKLMAIVVEAERGRTYLSPTPDAEMIATQAVPAWKPDISLPDKALGFRVQEYGMLKWSDLFSPRQLLALTTFIDLIPQVREQVERDAATASGSKDVERLDGGGSGPRAYADAIAVYLGMSISKMADAQSSLCRWKTTMDQSIATFARQALPMVWDYSEANPFAGMAGDPVVSLKNMMRVMEQLPTGGVGTVSQQDAQSQALSANTIISTDPPYYDNIGYADLSDFFYVWLRPALKPIFPDLFATVTVPKAEELVASPFRHHGRDNAERFFLDGMTKVMNRLSEQSHPSVPLTIYYAFKQSETENTEGTTSKGWVTFLEAVRSAGLAVTGTWPMRTELSNRMVGARTNALASSIVLVCRPRPSDAASISRRAFLRELNNVLPQALDEMTKGSGGDHSPVAPVDLSQAIIGPGMAVFSKYSAVLEADGTAMSVRTALTLINRFLAEDDFDHDTQFCLHWFEQHGWNEGKFGEADTLARAKGTSVDGIKHAGVLFASGGIVRLLKWADYPVDWDPVRDPRMPVWEVLHQMIRVFKSEGESGAGAVLAVVQVKAEATRQLAYRLYTLCERAGWPEDARAYNEIITSWSAIESAASRAPGPKQTALFEE